MHFETPDGATPIDAAEAEALIPSHITTQPQLNAWEQQNIADATLFYASKRPKNILSDAFVKNLHLKMFANTWRWAGKFRTTEKNIGVPFYKIPEDLRNLCEDAKYWVQHSTYPHDEIAVRFHHRIVSIHCFPNGNGRHARLIADLLIREFSRPPLTWGGQNISDPSATRAAYIEALKQADTGIIAPLLEFSRR